MFKIKRLEKGEENRFKVTVSEGYIEIAGTDEFVVRMIKSICEESSTFLEIMRESLTGQNHESVAKEMRKAGFDENTVRDFENDNFWSEFINE